MLRSVPWREIGMRALFAPLILLGGFALGVIGAFSVIFGRPERRLEVGRGYSRTLNGAWDGTGDVTFSAQRWDHLLRGKPHAKDMVEFVDMLPFNGSGHCFRAWLWHVSHGLLPAEKAADE